MNEGDGRVGGVNDVVTVQARRVESGREEAVSSTLLALGTRNRLVY